MENVCNVNYKVLYPSLSLNEIKYYSYQILLAIEYTHSKGILHRDIKPQNIVIDPSKKIVKLIDWGLACFYEEGKEYNLRVGTRQYKAPELLMGNKRYDYSVDVWSYGCILAAMLFVVPVFFNGLDR
eukprot:UN03535